MGVHGDRLGVNDHIMATGLEAKAVSSEKHLSGDSTTGSSSIGKHLSGDTPSTSVSEDKHVSGETASGESCISAESGSRFHSALSKEGHSPSGRDTPEGELGKSSRGGVDPRNTNLDYYHGEARFDQEISEGQFTKIKGLSECCRADGKVELHRWRKTRTGHHEDSSWAHTAGSDDSVVVVKRVLTSRVKANVGKEPNERIVCRGHGQRHAEDCLNEIGVYCYLAAQADLSRYILQMLTVFHSGNDVWLVLEHANSGDLFAVAQKLKREGTTLSVNQLMIWMWQLLQAVAYMHKHGIGHRDISMENVLLSDGVVRLMDFGQSVQTHTEVGTSLRYFSAVGKPYYRPPECYVPTQKSVEVHVPKDARPGELTFAQTVAGDIMCDVLLPGSAVPGQQCLAEPWGYAVPPVDIFACGVCFFILTSGMPPWKQANPKDPHFVWVHQCGISQLLKSWKKALPPAADALLTAMVHSVPSRRASVEQCLSHSWFDPLRATEPTVGAAPARPASASHRTRAKDSTLKSGTAFTSTEETPHDSSPSVSALEFLATTTEPYTRGLAVRSVAAPMEHLSSAHVSMIGDFYTYQEDVHRGSSPFGYAPAELTLERFTVDDVPPPLPTDDSFELEPTTFEVLGKEPVKLGNHLINFLSMGAGAVVTKVSTKKWSIKAEVNPDLDGESDACSLKVRIYDKGESCLLIEFQRRRGETTTFHRIFDQAADHLTAQSNKVPKSSANSPEKADPESGGIEDIAISKDETEASLQLNEASSSSCPAPPRARARLSRANTISANASSSFAPADLPERPCSEPANLPAGSGLNAVRSRSKSTLRRSRFQQQPRNNAPKN